METLTPPAVMEQSGIGRFSIKNVNGSHLTIGHCNDTFAGPTRSADPLQDWTDISDPALTETPRHYHYALRIREHVRKILECVRHLNRPSLEAVDWSKLTSKDVGVQWGNKTVNMYQTVDLKIFVNMDGGGEGGWVNFQHTIKLPRDAKLEGMEYTISDGVLTIIVPKDAKLAKTHLDPHRHPDPEGGTCGGVQDMDIDECR